MRVRRMDANGDMTFGLGSANFLVNTPAAVAQAASTRLQLWQGTWFLDTSAGVPYLTEILGNNTQSVYDPVIQAVLLGTPGMVGLANYSSSRDAKRNLTVTCDGITQYGTADLITVPISVPTQ